MFLLATTTFLFLLGDDVHTRPVAGAAAIARAMERVLAIGLAEGEGGSPLASNAIDPSPSRGCGYQWNWYW